MRHPRPTLSSLLLAAAPLQACGGDGDGEAPLPAPPPAPEPAPAPAPTPAATAVGAVLGTVVARARIGAQGGRLDAPNDGLALVLPAGAIDQTQEPTAMICDQGHDAALPDEQLHFACEVDLQACTLDFVGHVPVAAPGASAAGAARRARPPGMDRSRQPPRDSRRVGRGTAALVADLAVKRSAQ